MAMRKTGSRPVVVDGWRYRWRVRPSPTIMQGDYATGLTFSVQREDGGSVLVVVADRPRPDNWLKRPGVVVTPAVVAGSIRQALAAGWRAGEAGSPFDLAWVSDAEPSVGPNPAGGG
ncbi:MAG: hypothetical protein ACRC1K_14360 [Planctomycetia bacterium]